MNCVVREECRKVVGEDERRCVAGIRFASGPGITGTEVALWIILREISVRECFPLTLPGALCALGGNEHPFACQRIVPPVGVVISGHRAGPSPGIEDFQSAIASQVQQHLLAAGCGNHGIYAGFRPVGRRAPSKFRA